jgi:hypothetical protein
VHPGPGSILGSGNSAAEKHGQKQAGTRGIYNGQYGIHLKDISLDAGIGQLFIVLK